MTAQPNQPQTTENDLPKSLEDVENSHFTGEKLQEGFSLLQHFVADEKKFPLVDNFKRTDDGKVQFEPSHDLYIFTIGKQITDKESGNKKRVPHVIVGLAVPSIETIAAAEKGRDFIQKSLLDGYEKKVRSTFGKIDGIDLAELRNTRLPYSPEEFMASGRGDGGDNAVYKKYAKKMQAVLDERGLQISVNALKDCLMSKSVAEANFPKVKNEVWVKLLNGAVAQARQNGDSTEVFEHWLKTRDTASSDVEIEDINF